MHEASVTIFPSITPAATTSIFLGRPDLGHIAIFRAAEDAEREPADTVRDIDGAMIYLWTVR